MEEALPEALTFRYRGPHSPLYPTQMAWIRQVLSRWYAEHELRCTVQLTELEDAIVAHFGRIPPSLYALLHDLETEKELLPSTDDLPLASPSHPSEQQGWISWATDRLFGSPSKARPSPAKGSPLPSLSSPAEARTLLKDRRWVWAPHLTELREKLVEVVEQDEDSALVGIPLVPIQALEAVCREPLVLAHFLQSRDELVEVCNDSGDSRLGWQLHVRKDAPVASATMAAAALAVLGGLAALRRSVASLEARIESRKREALQALGVGDRPRAKRLAELYLPQRAQIETLRSRELTLEQLLVQLATASQNASSLEALKSAAMGLRAANGTVQTESLDALLLDLAELNDDVEDAASRLASFQPDASCTGSQTDLDAELDALLAEPASSDAEQDLEALLQRMPTLSIRPESRREPSVQKARSLEVEM